MVNLTYCQKEESVRNVEVEHFRKLNLKGRLKIKVLDAWCTKYLMPFDSKFNKFKNVVEAKPHELQFLVNKINENYDVTAIMDELFNDVIDPKTNKKKMLPSSLYKKRGRSYASDTLYGEMTLEAKTFLLKALNVRVCPYCNRNYIFSDGDINTCQLDHYFPQSIYPIFASSFYNLIPSCGTCNLKKNDAEFSFYPHDLSETTDDVVKFSFVPKSASYLSNPDDIRVNMDSLTEDFDKQVEQLGLRKIYGYHNDVVHDILLKNTIFSKAYLDALQEEFPELLSDSSDIIELLYGISLDSNEIGKRPLTKLTKDIIELIK